MASIKKRGWTRIETREVIDEEALYAEVGNRIRQVREAAGKSQGQLGQALGMTRASVSNIESGKQAIMLGHIYNVALYFKIDPKELLP